MDAPSSSSSHLSLVSKMSKRRRILATPSKVRHICTTRQSARSALLLPFTRTNFGAQDIRAGDLVSLTVWDTSFEGPDFASLHKYWVCRAMRCRLLSQPSLACARLWWHDRLRNGTAGAQSLRLPMEPCESLSVCGSVQLGPHVLSRSSSKMVE